jgi:hypothetical protein
VMSKHLGRTTRFFTGQITLCSQQQPCTLESLEVANSGDLAFKDFQKRLGKWINIEVLGLHGTGFQTEHSVALAGGDQVNIHLLFI